MKVVWTPEAVDDLEQLLTFLSERSPTAAASVASRINQAIKTIAEFPSAGRRDQDTGVREWIIPGFPLLIIYLTTTTYMEIIALFHSIKDWKAYHCGTHTRSFLGPIPSFPRRICLYRSCMPFCA